MATAIPIGQLLERDGGPGTSGEPAMTVETFSMDSELAPFLRGEFLIFDMRIVKPRAIVDIAEDGTIDWAMRPSSRFAVGQVSVEKLTITGGQIEVRHRISGRTPYADRDQCGNVCEVAGRTMEARRRAEIRWRADIAFRLDRRGGREWPHAPKDKGRSRNAAGGARRGWRSFAGGQGADLFRHVPAGRGGATRQQCQDGPRPSH